MTGCEEMGGKMNPYGSRAADLKNFAAHISTNLRLYSAAEGGRTSPILPGFGCPAMLSKGLPLIGFDCWPMLGDEPLHPGETRQVGFFFLIPDSAEKVRGAGRFFLWEGKFIGEAEVVQG
jgi:hypothetical protein